MEGDIVLQHSGIDCIKNKLNDGNEKIQLKTMDFIEAFTDEGEQW